jgi:histidinol dehydrogenase
MGKYSSEALGDYCAGTNHVLPTSSTARFSSPLGVYDFTKRSSIVMASKEGAKKLGETASFWHLERDFRPMLNQRYIEPIRNN